LLLRSFIQRICPCSRLFTTFRKKLIFLCLTLKRWRATSCHLSATAYSTYSMYSQLPSIHNPRTCHAAVTRDPPNMDMSTDANFQKTGPKVSKLTAV
jgi:hypothetical protein